ncbi:MAG TPA: hypothetical protein VFI68_02075 [Anaerolineales bacterium]|nr:hypothetical protein [Anaerolineales bacterium]
MESSVFLLLCLGGPIGLAVVFAFIGYCGGRVTTRIFKQVNPDLTEEKSHAIVKGWTISFALAGLVGGLPLGIGFGSYTISGFTAEVTRNSGITMSIGWLLFGIIAGAMGSFLTFRHFVPGAKPEQSDHADGE